MYLCYNNNNSIYLLFSLPHKNIYVGKIKYECNVYVFTQTLRFGQDSTQDQFLNGFKLNLPSPNMVAQQRLNYPVCSNI